MKDRNFKQCFETQIAKDWYQCGKDLEEKEADLQRQRREADSLYILTPSSKKSSKNRSRAKKPAVFQQAKPPPVLKQFNKVDLEKYLDGSKALPNRVSTDPYYKYKHFKFFPNGLPQI